MSTLKTKIICNHCGAYKWKPKKEVTRQLKMNPNRKFYCDQSCATSQCNIDKPRGNINNFGGKFYAKDKFSPFRYYLRKARTRKHECDLTLPYLKELWENQKDKCAYSGLEIKIHGKHTSIFDQASLDRIDSSKGYVEGNIQFIVLSLNLAKNSSSDKAFRKFLGAIRQT